MPENKIRYEQLEAGYEFQPSIHRLDADKISAYRKAVGDDSALFETGNLVPPTAIAAYAISALFDAFLLPPGAIHVTQELEFIGSVNAGETITCRAKVLRKQDRRGLHLMTVGIDVYNEQRKKVQAGKIGFLLPEPENG